MNRLLKFFYRFQNQRRIHTWATFWTVVKMAWAQSGRTRGCDYSIVCHKVIDIEHDYDNLVDDNYTITDIPFGIALNDCKKDEYVRVIFSGNVNNKLKSLTDEEYKHFMDSLEENEELMISLSNI